MLLIFKMFLSLIDDDFNIFQLRHIEKLAVKRITRYSVIA